MSTAKSPDDTDTAGATSDLMWSLVHHASLAVAALLSLVIVAPTLGAETFGAYLVAQAIALFALPIASLGPGIALVYLIIRERQDPTLTVERVAGLQLGLASVLVVCALIVGRLLIPTLATSTLAILFVGEIFVRAIIAAAAATFSALDSVARGERARSMLSACRVLSIVTLHLLDRLTVTSLVAATLGTAIALAAWAQLRARSLLGEQARVRRPDGPTMRTAARFAVPILGFNVQRSAQQLVFAGNDLLVAAGEFGIAQRFTHMATMPQESLMRAFHQRLLATKGVRGPLYRRVRNASLLLGALSSAVVLALAGLLPLLSGQEFQASETIARWLAVLVFLRAMVMPQHTLLEALGYPEIRARISAASAAVAVVANLAFIPLFGWKGAVFAAVISEATNLGATTRANNRRASRPEQTAGVAVPLP